MYNKNNLSIYILYLYIFMAIFFIEKKTLLYINCDKKEFHMKYNS